MDGTDDWNCGQDGLGVCQRYGQRSEQRHCCDGYLHMVRVLIGADILLQAGIGIDLLSTIHVSHIAERHGRFLVRHLARLRRKQRLLEQEHQNDDPAKRLHGAAVDEGHIESK